MDTKPVTIITGFLGAGKTTLLNHLIEKNSNIKYAIIENEFGEQSIDGELVVQPEDSIIELNNGCLCCTINDSLYDILNHLFDRKDQFDEIIIEATGLADPTGLAQPFITHPLIKKQFPLKGIVCLADAELIEDHLEETKEATNQISFSDVIFINKIDLVSEAYLPSLKDLLQSINPLATIIMGNQNLIPPIDFNQEKSPIEKLFADQQKSYDYSHEHAHGHSHGHFEKIQHHHHHEHTQEFNSITLFFDSPFDHALLVHALLVFLLFQSSNLYRMKGIIWLENSDQQHILQSVRKRFSLDEQRPWKPDEKRRSMIVFIGKNLKEEGLRNTFNKCLSAQANTSKKEFSQL